MNFVFPELLFFAALLPFIGFVWSVIKARRKKALLKMTNYLPRVRFQGVQTAMFIIGLTLLLVAASRPQWGTITEKFVGRSRNVALAIDVSTSMLAQDVRPNRLERAKADVADLIDSLEDDRCALIAFRRTGVVMCPLTTDRAFLRSALEKFSIDSAPRGETDLGSAIRASLDALDPAADDHNVIILISDGGDLRGEAEVAANLAKKRGVKIFTVGIGDPKRGATIPLSDGSLLKHDGALVKVKLETEALEKIASISLGRYVPLATAGTAETTLGAIYQRFLRNVAAKEQNEEDSRRAERYDVFLIPGLALLLLGAMFSRGRFVTTKKKK